MEAITVSDREAGLAGLTLVDLPHPQAAENDVAVRARDLAPLPADLDHTVAAALPISGLTAWQGLFEHGRLRAGQTVLVHGAAGAVGSIAVQLARPRHGLLRGRARPGAARRAGAARPRRTASGADRQRSSARRGAGGLHLRTTYLGPDDHPGGRGVSPGHRRQR